MKDQNKENKLKFLTPVPGNYPQSTVITQLNRIFNLRDNNLKPNPRPWQRDKD